MNKAAFKKTAWIYGVIGAIVATVGLFAFVADGNEQMANLTFYLITGLAIGLPANKAGKAGWAAVGATGKVPGSVVLKRLPWAFLYGVGVFVLSAIAVYLVGIFAIPLNAVFIFLGAYLLQVKAWEQANREGGKPSYHPVIGV